MVMEYIEGHPLADRLSKRALPFAGALRLAIQLADGLDAAHHAGVVRRDLKPANVVLTDAGAKLLDFGLAKATGFDRTAEIAAALPRAISPSLSF
jgi:serine/threonine-protein kinase